MSSEQTSSINDIPTDALEAALYGGTIESDGSVTPHSGEQSAVVEQQIEQPVTQEPIEEQQQPAAEQETQVGEAPAADQQHSTWTPDELRAAEIRDRNPDIRLETALDMARRELGIETGGEETQIDDETTPPEPTLAERVAAIEDQLNEAGANEGLFTKEIASLSQEYARLSGQLAVEKAREAEAMEVQNSQLAQARQDSVDRLRARHPESADPNTPIGQKMSEIIGRLHAQDNPLLYETDAPEKVFHLAISELPEDQRPQSLYTGHQTAPISSQKPTHSETPVAPKPTTETTQVVTVEPVSGSHRSVSSSPASIAPAQVGDMIRNMDVNALEAALYGTGEPGFFIR